VEALLEGGLSPDTSLVNSLTAGRGGTVPAPGLGVCGGMSSHGGCSASLFRREPVA